MKQYNLIDISKYSKEKLLKSKKIIDKVFLLERAESEEEITNQLIKKEMKGDDENMLACIEIIREENKRIRKEGMKEGMRKEKLKIIAEMKKNNMEMELIEKIVGLKIDEIEKMTHQIKYHH